MPEGLTDHHKAALESGAAALDEITCTTIHGFCQQLIRPYPVETGLGPDAEIIDPAAAELAYEDLMKAWLSARSDVTEERKASGVFRPFGVAGGEEDFSASCSSRNLMRRWI